MQKNQPDNCHFFAASFCTWITTTDKRDLRQLMKHMDKEGFGYNLYLVPCSHEIKYDIDVYQPQVEGTRWLGYFDKKKTAK
jgi:hypothetical protein